MTEPHGPISNDPVRQERGQVFVIETKLRPPPALPKMIERHRLHRLLDHALAYPLTLVAGPAGSGKTTLVSTWVRTCPAETAVGWLSLDETDSDPGRFGRYLVEALRRAVPCGDLALALLRSSEQPDLEHVLGSLINELTTIDRPVVLVLDDYHEIWSDSAHEALAFLLEHAPPDLHLVITSRSDPPLPLARMRVRQQVFDVHARELQFTEEEAAEYLNAIHGLGLSGEQVTALNRSIEGWAAGLQLAALEAPWPGEDPTWSDSARARRQPLAFDYLAGEVFDALDSRTQAFLLRTAIVDRISPSLGASLTGDPGAAEIIEQLRTRHLFTIVLDSGIPLVRYHHLFRDFLRHRLIRTHTDDIEELHAKAARWFLEAGLSDEALAHAEQSGRRSLVIEVLERTLTGAVMRGEVTAAQRWLRSATREEIVLQPGLALPLATLEFLHLRPGEARAWLAHAERALSQPEPGLHEPGARAEWEGQAQFVRAFVAHLSGDVSGALLACDQGLRHLSPSLAPYQWLTYVRALIGIGMSDDAATIAAFDEAIEGCWDTEFYGGALSGLGFLAFVRIAQGELSEAERIARAGLDRIAAIGLVPAAAALERALAEVHLERNELEQADHHAVRSRALDPEGIFCAVVSPPEHVQVVIALRRGELARAQSLFEQLAPRRIAPQDEREERVRGRTSLAQLATMLGAPEIAHEWAVVLEVSGTERSSYRSENRLLMLGRLLLADGNAEEAVQILGNVAASAREDGRFGRELKALTLLVVALRVLGTDEATMRSEVTRSLELAQREHVIGPFLDAGEQMLDLLNTLGDVHPFVREVVNAFRTTPGRVIDETMPLLSERELEVLRLLSAGHSNPEIASELVVSPETVKTHVRHIFRKLGVDNRLRAAQRARELDLV